LTDARLNDLGAPPPPVHLHDVPCTTQAKIPLHYYASRSHGRSRLPPRGSGAGRRDARGKGGRGRPRVRSACLDRARRKSDDDNDRAEAKSVCPNGASGKRRRNMPTVFTSGAAVPVPNAVLPLPEGRRTFLLARLSMLLICSSVVDG
jgi:hypothetical protein